MSVALQRWAPWGLVLFLVFGCSNTSAPSKAAGSAQSPATSAAPANAAARPAAGVAPTLEQSPTAAGNSAASAAAASATRPPAVKPSSRVRDEDVIAALSKTIDDFEHLKDLCRMPTDDDDLVQLVQVSYGDLDGDGKDEVAASAMTCAAGTYGPDVYGVFRIGESGELTLLNMEDAPGVIRGRDTHEGIRKAPGIRIEKLRYIETFAVYQEDDPNAEPSGGRREFRYRWDGSKLVLDDVVDFPPQ